MAFIHFKDGSSRTISAEQGVALWLAITGEARPTERQKAYIRRISRLYLNPHRAPASYNRRYAALIESMKPKPVRCMPEREGEGRTE